MKNLMLESAAIAIIAGGCLAGAPAYAQGAPNSGNAEQNASQAAVGDIVVTAQRREQSLQDVPISIVAVSAEQIENSGIQTTQDIAISTPGLTTTQNRNGMVPSLRGIGTQSANGEGVVAFYVDNVYYSSAFGSIFALNNVERVEVLKGPQGTLFGRNATGGLIHIITRDPSDTPEVNATIGYGNYDTVMGSLYATAGLASGISMNISLNGSDQNRGWGRNLNPAINEEVNYRKEWAVRSKLKLELGESTTAILSGDYGFVNSDTASNRRPVPGSIPVNGTVIPGSIYDGYSGIPRGGGAPFAVGGIIIGDDTIDSYQYGFSGVLHHDFSDAIALTSTTAHRKYKIRSYYDVDGQIPNLPGAFFADTGDSFQQEFLLNGSLSRLDWTAGAIYYESGSNYDPNIIVFPTSVSAKRSFISLKSWAVFGQGSYKITDQTTLTLGARYTSDRLSINAFDYNFATGVPIPASLTSTADRSRTHRKWSRPTWRIALDHQFTRDLLVYGSYSRGYKAGAYNTGTFPNSLNAAPIGDAANPEKLDAFELGFKSDLLDRQLRFNVAAYHYDYYNMQLQQLIPAGTGTALYNAGHARLQGVDFETVLAPRIDTGRLEFRFSGSVLDGKYLDFQGAPRTTPRTAPPWGNTNDFFNIPGDFSSKRIVRAPRFSSTVGLDYALPVSDSHQAGFNVTWQHNGKYYWDVDNRTFQKPTDIVNGQISFGRQDDGWKLRFWARNLLKEKYYTNVTSSGTGDMGTVAPPRTYGVALDVKFGGS